MRQINGLKLSLDEICTNIIRYAYGNGESGDDGDIRIEIGRERDRVVARIIDRGVPFDYDQVLSPDLNRYVREKRKGGLGIYLVRQLNDSVEYARADGRNVLTLVNNVEPKPSLVDLIKRNFRPSRMTIKVRFAVISTLIISCVTAGTFYLALLTQKRSLTRELVNGYVTTLKNFATSSADYILRERELLIIEQVHEILREDPTVVDLTVVDTNGRIVADREVPLVGSAYDTPAGLVPLVEQRQLVQEYQDPQFGPALYVSVPVRIGETLVGKAFMVLRKDVLNDVVESRMNRMRTTLYMTLFWFVGIAGISLMGNMFVNPIKKIAEEINRVGKEGTSGSFHYAGFGEFAEISTAFNRMMHDLRATEVKLTDQVRLKREMQLAQNIQQTLLPKQVPESEGFEIAARYDAAMEVGGDYYDFFFVDEHSIGLAVGDVSGKGIGGAFVMSIVRTALRLEARGNKNASEVLVKLNTTLNGEFRKGMYITLFYIILDSRKRVINYASAGHTPMILYRAQTDQLYTMNPRGFPIGLNLGDTRMFRKSIDNERISLNLGDLLFVYTDGITEAMNPEREEYGEKRLMEVIRNNKDLPVTDFADRCMEEIKNFTRGHPQNDDITFIVIKERKKYADLLFERRTRLFRLIEEEGVTVKEACERVGISRSTYYALKKLRDREGVEALRPQTGIRELRVLDVEIRQRIMEVIEEHPAYSAQKIVEALKEEEYGGVEVDRTLVYRELRRLKLSTREKRLAHVRRLREHERD